MSIDEILNGQPGTDYQVVIQANIKLYLKGVNLKMSQLDRQQQPISLKGAGIQNS